MGKELNFFVHVFEGKLAQKQPDPDDFRVEIGVFERLANVLAPLLWVGV